MPAETSSSSDNWQTIRPWAPPLSLLVREITSVSATFILSSTLTRRTSGDQDPSLSSLGLTDEDDSTSANGSAGSPTPKAVISEALAKGLSVNINASPWHRVLIRIDDKADEAVIIIFGLLPGRQYDIELGLVQAGKSSNIHSQVITEEADIPNAEVDQETSSNETVNSDPPTSTPSTSPTRTVPSTPPEPNANSTNAVSSNTSPQTLDDHLNHLHHTLSLLTSERDSLTASLKSTRRDSQKADAALRSEIDILKRTSEKHSAAEHRARQKVLALQEAVKRANSMSHEMEDQVLDVEAELPELKARRTVLEGEYAKVKEEADKVHRGMESEKESGKKRVEGLKGELVGLTNKLDRLDGKKEKLETNTIPDLEQQLKDIELEIQKIESDPYGSSFDAGINSDPQSPVPPSRPHQAPIQRPNSNSNHTQNQSISSTASTPPSTTSASATSGGVQRLWTQPRTYSLQRNYSHPRPSQAQQPQLSPPIILTNPSSSSFISPTNASFTSAIAPTSHTSSISATGGVYSTTSSAFTSPLLSQASMGLTAQSSANTGQGISLSSRAPPFEPRSKINGPGTIGSGFAGNSTNSSVSHVPFGGGAFAGPLNNASQIPSHGVIGSGIVSGGGSSSTAPIPISRPGRKGSR